MRDPARIPVLLAEIERVWLRHPDLRLLQLLLNLFPNSSVAYYTEDDALLKRLSGQPDMQRPRVLECAERLSKRLEYTHPDDLGDGMRRDIQELLMALSGGPST